MNPKRAVIDIGSSAVKYGVYDFTDTKPRLITEGDPVATSLGKGLARGGQLNPQAKQASIDVIRRFVDEIEALGAELTLVCATEAVRRAADQAEFLQELRTLLGPNPEIRCIEAQIEVEWGLASARYTLDLDESACRLFIDPGGSSNDFALTGNFADQWTSLPFGMNDLLALVPVSEEDARVELFQIEKLRGFLSERYEMLDDFLGSNQPIEVVGTSGAALAMGALKAGVKGNSRIDRIRGSHGIEISLAETSAMIEELAGLNAKERRAAHSCLSPTRSIIFIHGCLIYQVLLEKLGLKSFQLNGFGMKLGGLIAQAQGLRDPE